MNTIKKFGLVSVVAFAMCAFIACGDDSSTSSPTAKLPTEVKDLKELEEHKCDMSVIGEKVFVESEDLLYECDGDAWFKSYDQTKPNSAKSSSSTRADGEGDDDYSSNSEKGDLSSSSGAEQISWPEGVKPSGYYAKNCPEGVNCKNAMSSFEYLNQEMLAAGKYGEMLDTRDGQVYKVVNIHNLTWMAENLNYDPGDVSSMGEFAWSGCYNDEADSCAKYGRLYTWEVAMNDAECGYGYTCNPTDVQQGVCPTGWHLPTYTELRSLYERNAGLYLKSQTGWKPSENALAGIDMFGFSALPAGQRYLFKGERFVDAGYYTFFWSTTQDGDNYAYTLELRFDFNRDGHSITEPKAYANSVRCVKD